MNRLLPTLACALLTCSTAIAAPTANSRPGTMATARVGQITEITLERQPGFVVNPKAFKVVFYSTGRAVAIMGTMRSPQRYEGTIYPHQFRRLSALMQQSYFGLRSEYTAGMTDMPTVLTSAVRGGRRKSIRNYADQGPANLWGIEMAIRGVAADIDWQEVPAPSTTPAP